MLVGGTVVDCSNVSTKSKLHLQPMTTRLSNFVLGLSPWGSVVVLWPYLASHYR